MDILKHPAEVRSEHRGGSWLIGTFDGLHLGHRALISHAARHGRPLGIITFEPHPRSFFDPCAQPSRLATPEGKIRAFAELGVDVVLVLSFDQSLAALSPQAFVHSIVLDSLAPQRVYVGYDFAFGYQRSGTGETLRTLLEPCGVTVHVIAAAQDAEGVIYSSSRVRELLIEGSCRKAAHSLGGPWEIEGPVIRGDQRGQTLGFPTANIALGSLLRPRFGVYAVYVTLASSAASTAWAPSRWLAGVANIGQRPTVNDGKEERLEVHIFNFSREIYGLHLRVALVEFLRSERAFADLNALSEQIHHDIARARACLA